MPDFVIDANILFSSMLTKKELYIKMFNKYHFYTPDFALEEIKKYQEIIVNKTTININQFKEYLLFNEFIDKYL